MLEKTSRLPVMKPNSGKEVMKENRDAEGQDYLPVKYRSMPRVDSECTEEAPPLESIWRHLEGLLESQNSVKNEDKRGMERDVNRNGQRKCFVFCVDSGTQNESREKD